MPKRNGSEAVTAAAKGQLGADIQFGLSCWTAIADLDKVGLLGVQIEPEGIIMSTVWASEGASGSQRFGMDHPARGGGDETYRHCHLEHEEFQRR